MPWKSDAQRRWGNSPAGHAALGDAGVAEWNSASKGQHVPEHVKSYANGGPVVANKGYLSKDADFAHGGGETPRTGDWKKTVPNRGFLDTKDRFRNDGGPDRDPKPEPTEDVWGKGSSKANPKPQDKSEKPIKPRG